MLNRLHHRHSSFDLSDAYDINTFSYTAIQVTKAVAQEWTISQILVIALQAGHSQHVCFIPLAAKTLAHGSSQVSCKKLSCLIQLGLNCRSLTDSSNESDHVEGRKTTPCLQR